MLALPMGRACTVILAILSSLLIAVGSLANASMAYIPQPLAKTVSLAEIVAHVRITTVTVRPCGTDYVAEAVKIYRGKNGGRLSFTSRRSPLTNRDREVREGDELLVLLMPRSPQGEPHGSCCAEAKSPPPSKPELQCREQLASYTPLQDLESAFLLERRADATSASPTIWLWYDRLRTELPADIERRDIRAQSAVAGKCSGPYCMVRWKTLEPRIRDWAKR